MTEHRSPIPARVYNAAVGGHVCGPDDIDFGQKVVHLIKYDRAGNEVSFESQVTQPNKIYVIHDNFTLSSNVNIPANCVLKFEGGILSGDGTHTLTGNNTVIDADPVQIFNNVIEDGSWSVTEYYLEWFGAKGDYDYINKTGTDDTDAIKAAFKWNSYDDYEGYQIRRNSKKIRLLNKCYYVTDTLYIPQNTTLEGTLSPGQYYESSDQEYSSSRIVFNISDLTKDALVASGFVMATGERYNYVSSKYAGGDFQHTNSKCRHIHLKNIAIINNSGDATHRTRIGIVLSQAIASILENVTVDGFMTGVFLQATWDMTFRNCHIQALCHGVFSVGCLNCVEFDSCYVNGAKNYYSYSEADDALAEGSGNAGFNIYRDCSSAFYIRNANSVILNNCIVEHWEMGVYFSHSTAVVINSIYNEDNVYLAFGQVMTDITIDGAYIYLPYEDNPNKTKHKNGVVFWDYSGAPNHRSHITGQYQVIADVEDPTGAHHFIDDISTNPLYKSTNGTNTVVQANVPAGYTLLATYYRAKGLNTYRYNDPERNTIYVSPDNGNNSLAGDYYNRVATIEKAVTMLEGEKGTIILENGKHYPVNWVVSYDKELYVRAETLGNIVGQNPVTNAYIDIYEKDGKTDGTGYLGSFRLGTKEYPLTLQNVDVEAMVSVNHSDYYGIFTARGTDNSCLIVNNGRLIPKQRVINNGLYNHLIHLMFLNTVIITSRDNVSIPLACWYTKTYTKFRIIRNGTVTVDNITLLARAIQFTPATADRACTSYVELSNVSYFGETFESYEGTPPALTEFNKGFRCYDVTNDKDYVWNGSQWKEQTIS